jgi:hypothetical protein
MTDTAPVAIPFACPRCDRELDPIDNGHRCEGCKVDFPLVGDVPWLFAEPGSALAEWRTRFDYLQKVLHGNSERYRETARRHGLPGKTKARLDRLAAATVDHAARLRELLAPLADARPETAIETYLALRTRLPPDQGLMTYFPNVHRDWCWGSEENAASLAVVRGALAERTAGRTLVAGAGAGRLAYDWHQETGATTTIALDFNPLLVWLGRRIASGETIELYEFPLAPRDEEHTAVLRQLRAPAPARPGLEFVVADVHRAPFGAKTFDTIVTPWLVDILPGDFAELCGQINHWLADGGAWINFGSLNFHRSDPAAQLGPEECAEILGREGFEVERQADTEIPYLCSPASRHGRRETVLSWCAAKRSHRKKLERHQALPDWIVRGREPIPAIEQFRVTAATTRIHAFIMSLIDGKRSIADMAALLEQQRLMPARDAEAAIRGLLIRLYDESQIRRP